MSVDIVVRLIALARQSRTGLAGISVRPEERLNPQERKPVVDMLVALLGGKNVPHHHLVPWTSEGGRASEHLVVYAIENDRGTMTPVEVRGQAAAYRRLARRWKRQDGPFPVVLWVVPSEDRLHRMLQAWREGWPEGGCLFTTNAWLASGDRWLRYRQGTIDEQVALFPT